MSWPSASARPWSFPNNDKVFHNVFSFRDGKKFDLGMYPKGDSQSASSSTSPGSRGCSATSIRTWPPTSWRSTRRTSPCRTRTARSRSPGVPPGTYTYHAWRPGGQPLTGSVTVDGDNLSKSVGSKHSRAARLFDSDAHRSTRARADDDRHRNRRDGRLFGRRDPRRGVTVAAVRRRPGARRFLRRSRMGRSVGRGRTGCRRAAVRGRPDWHRRVRRRVPLRRTHRC